MRLRSAVIATAALALPATIMTGPAAADGPEVLALVGLGGAATGVEVEALQRLGLDVTPLSHVPSVIGWGTPTSWPWPPASTP